jgi:hypothetical protein
MTNRDGLDYVTDDLPCRTWTRVEGGVQCASFVRRGYPSGCDLDSRRPEVRNLVRCGIAKPVRSRRYRAMRVGAFDTVEKDPAYQTVEVLLHWLGSITDGTCCVGGG